MNPKIMKPSDPPDAGNNINCSTAVKFGKRISPGNNGFKCRLI